MVPPVALVEVHFVARDVAHLGGIVGATHADVALYPFHALAFYGADELHLFGAGSLIQRAQHGLLVGADQGLTADRSDGFDEGNGHVGGDVEGLDEDLFAGLDAHRVAYQQFGKALHTWIEHESLFLLDTITTVYQALFV
ncbi:MAG: hypothetical protein RLY87_1502 [Chloroflexota bacterium]